MFRMISRGLGVTLLALVTVCAFIRAADAAVGRTPGTFAVSPGGAGTYTIPIWTPPGPNGLQPNIALAYSSQGGYGSVGAGWNIVGLSAIYRCNRTFAQDGAPAPVTLTTSDALCLDGQRLRLTAGTQGIGGSTYQTEVANFSNVSAYGTAGNGPAYFVVQGHDGRTYYYGNGGGSQVLANGGTTALSWQLNEVVDRAGNTMTIAYNTATGSAVPSTISWTPTAYGASSYLYTMQFTYQANVAPPQGYVGGTSVINPNLLSSITINYSGNTVKNYVLKYQESGTTGRDELISIQECADAGATNCLAATQMSYQNSLVGGAGVTTTLSTGVIAGSQVLVYSSYDFDGNGYHDLVYCNGGSPDIIYVVFGSANGYGAPVNTGIACSGLYGDLQGTGRDGILAANGGTWYYYTWNGSAFAGVSTGLAYDSTAWQYVLADINGDGLPDLVSSYVVTRTVGSTRVVSSEIYTRLNTTSAGGAPSFSATDTSAYATAGQAQLQANSQYGTLRSFDFNGDGMQDLSLQVIASNGASITTYELISTGQTFTATEIATTGTGGSYVPVYFLNFNSDACTDYLVGGTLYVSGCNGTIPATVSLGSATVIGAMDWSGNGLTDILVANGSTIGVYLSTGNGISSLVATAMPYSSTNQYFVFDANGDGLDDLGVWTGANTTNGNTSLTYYLHNNSGQPPDLLTSIADGYGNSVSPTYVSIDQSNYSRVLNPTYPGVPAATYRYFTGPLYVVNQATFSDPSSPANATYQQTFYYYDAWMSLQGRGFMGFSQQQRHDSRNGVWDTYGYCVQFPCPSLPFFDLTSTDQAGNQKIRYAFNNLEVATLDGTANNQRYFPYFNNMTLQTYEVGGAKNGQLISTRSSSYAFDSYGNALTIATTVTDNDSSSPYFNDTWTTTVSNTTDVDTTHWCLNLFTATQVSYTPSVGGSVTRTKQFTPDTTNCRYTQVVTEPNSSAYKVTEAIGYDSFGNVNSKTVTGINMAARQSTVNWGTTGQFPMSVTDPSGATNQVNYNSAYGEPSSTTDANGLTTSWQYDAFTRETLEIRPDGTQTSITYNGCAPPNTCQPLSRSFIWRYKEDTQGNVITSAVTTYDALDRPTGDSYHSLTGVWPTVSRTYDSLGRLASKTEPYFSVNTPYTEIYTYDALNRMIESQRPVSASNSSLQPTTYQYSGDTTISTDANGHTKTTVTDPNGWLRQTTDATGYTITLGYDAAGSKTSATDSLGNTLWSATYQYGSQPFQVATSDADLGPWSYVYDALGELIGWTDAKGQHFSATYDALSRTLTRSEPDLFTQWTWGSGASQHNIGKLQSVCTSTGTNPTACTSSGYAESATYDTVARLAQRSIQIPGDRTYSYAWQYNTTTGLLAGMTYPTLPSGYALQLAFAYANGQLQTLTDTSDTPNVTLWTGNATAPTGQFTQETLGNGVVVNHSFDAVTGWLSSITAGVGGGTALQNNSYLFDEVGNLTQRQDNNAGTTENVYYDALNRLTSTVGDTNTQLSYDSMGRASTFQAYGNTINNRNYTTAQSGCSYYSYAQPHAVRQNTQGTNSTSFCYDANGNTTTVSLNGAAPEESQTWTSYNQPNLVTGAPSSSQFSYDYRHQRWLQVASYSGSPETTEYIGGMLEKMTNSSGTAYRYYIPAGNNLIVYNRWSTGSNPIYYITKDHLGSSAVITNQAGALVVHEKFAALGWNENTATEQAAMATVTRHEYTGEEGLDNAGLWMVNLNGRLYSPSGFSFMSPDPFVPDPSSTRDYNRYAYARYNPLTFVDPSGYDTSVCVPTESWVDTSGQDPDGLYFVGGYYEPSEFCYSVPDFPGSTPGGAPGGTPGTPPAPPPLKPVQPPNLPIPLSVQDQVDIGACLAGIDSGDESGSSAASAANTASGSGSVADYAAQAGTNLIQSSVRAGRPFASMQAPLFDPTLTFGIPQPVNVYAWREIQEINVGTLEVFGKVLGGVGTVIDGASTVNDFMNQNYFQGGLDAASTGAGVALVLGFAANAAWAIPTLIVAKTAVPLGTAKAIMACETMYFPPDD